MHQSPFLCVPRGSSAGPALNWEDSRAGGCLRPALSLAAAFHNWPSSPSRVCISSPKRIFFFLFLEPSVFNMPACGCPHSQSLVFPSDHSHIPELHQMALVASNLFLKLSDRGKLPVEGRVEGEGTGRRSRNQAEPRNYSRCVRTVFAGRGRVGEEVDIRKDLAPRQQATTPHGRAGSDQTVLGPSLLVPYSLHTLDFLFEITHHFRHNKQCYFPKC